MAGSANAKLKPLYLLQIFQEKTDEEHPLSAEGLCKELENRGVTAQRKSIYGDIELLKSIGLDILHTRTPKSGYFLASRTFETAEVRLLLDAVQSASFITPKKTAQLVEKLESLVSEGQAARLDGQVYMDNRVKCCNEEIYYTIEILDRAIQAGRQVRFQYARRVLSDQMQVETQEKEFLVNPYALIWSGDHYYLICNNPKYDNLMHARLDRIRRAKALDTPARDFREVSEYTDFFDAADYVNQLFHMFSGETDTVELCCGRDMIEEILDRFGETALLRTAGEDQFLVKFEAKVSDGFVSWLMQYGDRAVVRSPLKLKTMLREKARAILHNYGG
ncbi:MAG: WYL domain-containing transcriptional regulator [Clostridiales bacterium]|nr:WYL domain-containing transcriptional regulator [Clostridiales bacterium]